MSQATQNRPANGLANGAGNGTHFDIPKSTRFADIPSTIDVPVAEEDEAVEIDLEELADDPTELCTLFEMERAARTYWMTVTLAYAKQKKIDFAIEMLIRGANAMQVQNPREKLSMVAALCWMYLWKSREAPRVAPEGLLASEAKTKEYYLQQANAALNEASRINPGFPPLFLARGALSLQRASLQAPPSSVSAPGPGAIDPAKAELLRSAIKSFDDAIRASQGKNMVAVIGKSHALYSFGRYAEALAGYQEALAKMPTLVDPDPRIGIGCCFWKLGFKDDAKSAWERSLEINRNSKIAHVLLGLYYLSHSRQTPTNTRDFVSLYKKALADYIQTSFTLDHNLPLTCATLAEHLLAHKHFADAEALAHKAIQYTDVNAIASDGWYLLARKEHLVGDVAKASDFYRRADDARGGAERGYLPAKLGAAQLSVSRNDIGEAKLRLEKIIQQSKNYEAHIILGTLYAEEAFVASMYPGASKEDKKAEAQKAIALLESVRSAWKDAKKNYTPDPNVLLNLARLYESTQPEKALQCLQQVEQMEIDRLPPSLREQASSPLTDQGASHRGALRKLLPPQLLSNIGCFYFQAGKHELASEMFEAALEACMEMSQGEDDAATDALVTTISFNLGRSYEARGMPSQAVEVYERLLARHSDYTDARTRLAHIKLRKNPNKDGPDAIAKLYQENSADLEVRALYGWFLSKVNSRRRPANLAQDPELRHYKHTLQNYDKHDRYALVGMGNMYLVSAREMRRDTEHDKQKRGSVYARAIEFFDKALQLDPQNAYAAQGIAIALVEDKKDYRSALPIFLKVRETVNDAQVLVNLGHIYFELHQFSKAIESYQAALSREGKSRDVGIIACLGRTWLSKGRADRDLDAYKRALEHAQQALEISPEQIHFKFNVAFVQIQLAQTIVSLAESQRTSNQLIDAIEGLESAIKALEEIAAHPQAPYPKHDIEQRANMARNTQRRQLDRALSAQRDYEARNKEKLTAALELRQAELRRREEERRQAEEALYARQEKLRKEREEIAARDRALAEARLEQERARQEAEYTTDSETGQKRKRRKTRRRVPAPRVRSSDGEGTDGEGDKPRRAPLSRRKKGGRAATAEDDDEAADGHGERKRAPLRKKQRLTTRKDAHKYKSAEIVVDSDDSDDDVANTSAAASGDDDDALTRMERSLQRQIDRSRGRARKPDEESPSPLSSPAASDTEGRLPPPRTRGRRHDDNSRMSDDDGGERAHRGLARVDEPSPEVDAGRMSVNEKLTRPRRVRRAMTASSDADVEERDKDEYDEEMEEAVVRRPQRRGARVLDDSDEDEEMEPEQEDEAEGGRGARRNGRIVEDEVMNESVGGSVD